MALIVSRGGDCRSYTVGRVLIRIEDGPLDTPCHIWQGAKLPSGYGHGSYQRRHFLAHRRAWERAHGEIPAGHQIHHACERRACVNPDHLELVTPTEHAARHPQVAR